MSAADRSGQAEAFLALTPVLPGEQDALRATLRGLGDDSPFARVPGTHVARLLVVDDFHHDPSWGQRHEDHLDLSYLVLSSCVDGPVEAWLDRFARATTALAPEVWGRCVGGPTDGDPAALRAYLLHNRLHTGVFFAAYGDATVEEVTRALRRRDRLRQVAVRAQGLEPAALQSLLLHELGSPA